MSNELDWFKSSHSGSGGDNCLEVALDVEAVHIRDSKDTGLGAFTTTPDAWASFVTYASGA